MEQNIAHQIKHRQYANDEFMTPPELARQLVALLPLQTGNFVVDPCSGVGAFLSAFPTYTANLGLTEDFFIYGDKVDWLVSNPPYSKLDDWLRHSFEIAEVGVAYLLGLHNITPRRLELANSFNFGLTSSTYAKSFSGLASQPSVFGKKARLT